MPSSTRVFISATSGDMGSVRQLVKEALLSMDCHPVEQTNFPPDYRKVEDMLREKIASCQAVIHIVGRRYGHEPDLAQLPAGTPRRSFTQMEYDIARRLKKKVYVFLCPDDFPYDKCNPEAPELEQLQQRHRESITADPHLRNEVATREELGVRVREMQVELNELRQQMRRGKRAVLVGVAVLILVLGGVVWGVGQLGGDVDDVAEGVTDVNEKVGSVAENVEQLESTVQDASQQTLDEIRKLYEDPDVLSGKLKSHIRQRADEEIAKAKAENAKWQAVEKIEKARDSALDRVEDMVATIRNGLAGQANEVFAEAARILAEEGVEQAIEYLKSKQPALLQQVDRLIDRQAENEARKRDLLQPLLLKADLHETRLEFDEARSLYEIVAEKAPQWSSARRKLGRLLDDLAEFEAAEPHLLAALDLAEDDEQRSLAVNDLALLYLHQARYDEAEALFVESRQLMETLYGPDHAFTATALSNLALVLTATNRLAEAEPLIRSALAIDEQSHGAEHPNVAIRLNNLALLLKDTNRVAEAEPLYRRALAINEQSYGAEHLKVAIRLNNLALLLQDTNRRAEAEPLIRRALAIDEASYGAEHANVAAYLNNLAQLLQATNRLAEAEPLMRRALAIDEQSSGVEHLRVADQLNNLARFLMAANRLPEAEPLMRRALAINEQSYGDEHPKVATRLNHLTKLFYATNRLAEAEPLIRRALAIDEQSYGPEHPEVATGLNNLAVLLYATNRLAEADQLSRRHLEIFVLSGKATGHEHPRFRRGKQSYARILQALELGEDEIERRFAAIDQVERPLQPILPIVEKLLGPARPVDEVLAALDEQYKQEGKPEVYFLSSEQPIAPHLDELLGPSKLAVAADKTLAAQLDELLGPAKSTKDVIETLDRQYREQGKPPIYFLPLDQPITPHLDELLGPLPE